MAELLRRRRGGDGNTNRRGEPEPRTLPAALLATSLPATSPSDVAPIPVFDGTTVGFPETRSTPGGPIPATTAQSPRNSWASSLMNPGLEPEQRDGQVGADHGPGLARSREERLTRVGVQAGRDVHRQHRALTFVEGVYQFDQLGHAADRGTSGRCPCPAGHR